MYKFGSHRFRIDLIQTNAACGYNSGIKSAERQRGKGQRFDDAAKRSTLCFRYSMHRYVSRDSGLFQQRDTQHRGQQRIQGVLDSLVASFIEIAQDAPIKRLRI